MMTPVLKVFRGEICANSQWIWNRWVCQEWDSPHLWQREERKEPFCREEGLCYRSAELKNRGNIFIWQSQPGDRQEMRWACRWECWNHKKRYHKSHLWPKLDVQKKSLAIIYTAACIRHTQNGVLNICSIPPSSFQAKSSQQAAALPGVNHVPKNYNAHMYFIHTLQANVECTT